MTKKKLIDSVSEECGVGKATVERVLDGLGGVTAAELLGGGGVLLPGLGKLKAEERKARMGRNPRDGKPVRIPARTVVKFAAGKELKNALRG